MNKFFAKKTVINGRTFDSRKEANRYLELCNLEKAGEIMNLETQVKFKLVPEQREPDTVGKRGGKIKGKVIERPVTYIADFVYVDAHTGHIVVEDTKCKATRTPEYIIKRKLMLYVHDIRITEI